MISDRSSFGDSMGLNHKFYTHEPRQDEVSRPLEDSRRRKTALMIAFHFPPSILTGAKRPFRFARYLQPHGYDAHVVTHDGQSKDAPWPNTIEAPSQTSGFVENRFSEIAAALQRFLPYNDQLPWVAHAVAACNRFIARHDVDVLISTSPPVACHLAAGIVSCMHGIPWVADFRDPIYGNPSRSRSWGWIWDAPVDRAIASRAAAIIANTDTSAEMLRRRYPRFAERIHVIWNGYDPDRMLAARSIPPRTFSVLVHAGTLYGPRHPTLLLSSLYRLISHGRLRPENIRVRFVGEFFSDDPWVKQSRFRDLLELGCVEHTEGFVSPAEAERQMAEADYLLLLDLNDKGVNLQVPAKIFEYIQIGRPILAFTGKASPTERILAGSGVPHVVLHPETADEVMDQGVLEFLKLRPAPRRPTQWFRKQFDGAEQTRRLAEILSSVTAARTPKRR